MARSRNSTASSRKSTDCEERLISTSTDLPTEATLEATEIAPVLESETSHNESSGDAHGCVEDVSALMSTQTGLVSHPLDYSEAELVIKRVNLEHPTLTRVESLIAPDAKIVPDPVTLPVMLPDCGVYTGPGYARSEVNVKDVNMVEERIIYKKRVQVIERPYEVIREVVKPIVKQVVEFKKIIDENDVVEVPKPYTVTTKKFVPNFIDTARYAVTNSVSKPNVVYDEDPLPVECLRVVPDVKVVTVNVPKVVDGTIVCKKGLTRLRRLSGITKEEWNSLVLKMNPDLCEFGDLDLFPVYKNAMGQVIALKPTAM